MSIGLLPSELPEDDMLKCAICTSTIEDPVLLKCLHSACRSCISDTNGRVTCPVCQVTTDTAAAAAGITNMLVSSLAHRSRVLQNVFFCPHCIDEDRQDATANVWCYTCQQPLCTDFQKCHNILYSTHKIMPLTERTILSELYRPPVRCCSTHGEELRFACFTCRDGCCSKCAHDCYQSAHDILPLECSAVPERISDKVAGASSKLSDLSAKSSLLQSYLRRSEQFFSERQESLNTLRNAKTIVIDSINRAYVNAERSLLECWDTVASKSFHFQEAVEILKKRLDWTNKYCQMAIQSNDVAGLLPQLDAMFSSLTAVLDEARLVKEPVDPHTMISVRICVPDDLDTITGTWFGIAKVVCDDESCSVNESPAGNSREYYALNAPTSNEVLNQLEKRYEYHEHFQHDKLVVASSSEQSFVNEAKKQLEQQSELQEHVHREDCVVTLPREQFYVTLTSEAWNVPEKRSEPHEHLQHKSHEMTLPSKQLIASTSNEAANQLEKRREFHEHLEHDNRIAELSNDRFFGNEAKNRLKQQSEHHEHLQHETRRVSPPSEQFISSSGNEATNLFEKRSDRFERVQRGDGVLHLPGEKFLASSEDETGNLHEKQNEFHERLQHGSRAVQPSIEQLPDNEVCSFLEKHGEYHEHLRENSVVQLPGEQPFGTRAGIQLEKQKEHRDDLYRGNCIVPLPNEQLLAGYDARHAPDERKEYHEQLPREKSMSQLPHEQFRAMPMPLSFDNDLASTFKGPGKCWDVALTPQGRLLVAATLSGLKEYDATSFREIATWMPHIALLGEHQSVWVSTVDSLADGRAVVGLFFSMQVVVLQRHNDGEAWRVERRLVELQAPPRRLSACGDQLLAVLEDHFEERTKSWRVGTRLVLISLVDDKPSLRRELEYSACSIALTDRVVVVSSNDAIEPLENDGNRGCSKKSYVVDCFSHSGMRLWRHCGLKVMSLCADSVARVLYAAKSPGSVVALSIDDGCELSSAIATKDTEKPYAMSLDKATRRMLALLSLDGDEPNVVTIFCVA